MLDLLEGANDGLYSGICVFDLAKCFDTIDHDILLIKLEKYGIRGTELSLFKSYLEHRNQCTRVGSVCSDKLPITKGIPQGSILGPLLFLVFMNDFPTCLRSTQCNQFADDTITYVQGSTVHEIGKDMQSDANNIHCKCMVL